MNIKELKPLGRFFIIFFFVIFLIVNWTEISLFFNYKVIRHNISDIFKKEEAKNPSEADFEEKINKENSVEIPKIAVSAPIVSAEQGNSQDFKQSLDKGILLYPESVLPGEKGMAVILGHSAPAGWPDINFDNIFNDLNALENGDEIFVFYRNKKYEFGVFDKKIFLPENEKEVFSQYGQNKPYLALITCWPPGKDYKRLGVFAEIK